MVLVFLSDVFYSAGEQTWRVKWVKVSRESTDFGYGVQNVLMSTLLRKYGRDGDVEVDGKNWKWMREKMEKKKEGARKNWTELDEQGAAERSPVR